MSNQLQITGGAKVRSLEGVITGTSGVLSSVPLGGANGVATLDSGGKVPVSQLPSSVVTYLGTWNAATNTPTLTNGTGDAGDMYICNVAGTVNFGAGPITFSVGDWVLYGSGTWQKSSGQNGTVTSVGLTAGGNALTISNSPIVNSGNINVGFAGSSTQYIAGDGTLVTFPTIITEAQNLITDVYNETGATLTKGTVVYINGGHGNLPTVTKAIATGDSTSAQTYGVVQADITNNNNGHVVVIGSLGDLDTQAYAAGTQLYLSSTTAGAWTSTKQYAPAHLVYVGIVVRSHPTQGVVEIKIQNGFELDELHNVSAQSPSNGNILQYNSTTSLWTAVAGTTTNIAEGTNLYYTDARSRAAFSETVTGLDYNSTTGVLSTTTGYGIPTTANQTNWTTAYNNSIVSAAVTGTTTKTLTLTQQDGGTVIASWSDYDTAPVTSVFGRTGAITAQSGDYTTTLVTEGTNLYFTNARARGAMSANVGSALTYDSTTGRYTLLAADSGTDGYLTAADWTDFDSKQASLGTGTTSQFLRGDLTWAAPPTPALDDLTDVTITSPTNGQLLRWQIDHWENWTLPSYVQTTRTLTINGTAYDLSANRTWSVGTITDLTGEATASGTGSVAVTLTNSAVIGKVLTGLNVTGGSVAATDSILTAFGKVQNQINGLIGGSIYKGTWNASTNTPALASSVGTAGWYYIVSVAGSTNLNGITDWQLGDWAIFNGGVWQKVDNTDSVVSVNGFTGAVSLTTDNISEGATNLYYTNTRARAALSANVGSALTYNSSTGRFTLNAADGTTEGYVTAADYNYWDAKQDSLGTGTTSQWLRGDLTWSTVPAPALDDLTDVTITTPSNGQLLRYQAGTWINFTPTYIVAGYLSATAPLSYNSGTGVFSISQATTSTNGYLSSTDFNTFNDKQNTITLTTTGTSGAATLVGSTLNIPQYQAVLTNPVTGTGTTNYLPKFTGTSTIGNSLVYDNGTNVGIGTSSPSRKLDISTGSDTDAGLIGITIGGTVANSRQAIIEKQTSGTRTLSIYSSLSSTSLEPISFYTGIGYERLTILEGGNVGIGTASPTNLIHGYVSSGSIVTILKLENASVTASSGTAISFTEGGTERAKIVSQIGTGTTPYLAFENNGAERLRITSGGNVGIGSTAPSGKLEVNTASGFAYFTRTEGDNGTTAPAIGIATASTAPRIYSYGDLQFWNAAVGGTATNKMTLFNTGNLAVGTTTDAGYKLDVNGTGRFASALTVTNGNIQFGTSENVLKWTSGNGVIEWGSAGTLYLRPTGAASNSLTIASTGAATFTFDNNSSGVVYSRNVSGTIYELGSVKNSGSDILYQGTGSVFINADSNSDSTAADREVRLGNRGVAYMTLASTGAATFSSATMNIGTSTSRGNVTIEQTTTNAGLVINSAIAESPKLYLRDGGGAGYSELQANNNLYLNASKVGIGTSSPISLLTVYGSAGTTIASFGSGSGLNTIAVGYNNSSYSTLLGYNVSAEYGYIQSISANTTTYDDLAINPNGGNVLIGTTTNAGYKLDVSGTGRFSNFLKVSGNNALGTSTTGGMEIAYFGAEAKSRIIFGDGSGYTFSLSKRTSSTNTDLFTITDSGAATFSSSVTATGFFESSDKRLKKEISDNPTINIEGIKPKLYIKDGKEELGYYAQDLQEILPSSVTEGQDGFLSLSYTQVHTAKIASLEKEVAELKELIKTLIK